MKKGIEDDFLLKSRNSFGEERFRNKRCENCIRLKGRRKVTRLLPSSVLHSRDGAASKGREQRSNVFCPFSTLAETKQFSCVSPSPVFQRLRPSNRAPPILRPSLRRVKERERERKVVQIDGSAPNNPSFPFCPANLSDTLSNNPIEFSSTFILL